MPTSYYRDAKGAVLSQGRDAPRQRSKPLELKYTPEGVCYNCLNRAHDICLSGSSAKTCACRDRNHDDTEWWVPEGGRAECLATLEQRPVELKVLQAIDDAIAPPMSKRMAYDILIEVANGIDARIDALRDELRAGKT